MRKLEISYVCFPLHGHLDWGGTMETLKELKERGHKVNILSGEPVREYVETQGLEFVDIGLTPPRKRKPGESIEDQLMSHQHDAFRSEKNITRSYHQAIAFLGSGNTDFLLGDPLCKTGSLIANTLDIPFVRIGPTDFSSPEPKLLQKFIEVGDRFESDMRANKESFGISTDAQFDLVFIQELAKLHINFSTPVFEGEKVNSAFAYVGSDALPMVSTSKNEKTKVLYTSGTLFWDERQVQTVLTLATLYSIELHVMKANLLPSLSIPDSVQVHDFVDDKQLLPQMDLLITQGGLGTVVKGIRAGLPMIVLPLLFANFPQAEKVQNYGNGKAIIGLENQQSELNIALEEMLDDTDFKDKALELREDFISMGGSIKAANLIEELS